VTFPANAQSYEEALRIRGRLHSDTDAAVAGIAASGNPLAVQVDRGAGRMPPPVQRRRQEGLHPEARRGLLDAATGWPVSGAEPAGLNPVRVNNRVRRAIDAALGSLTLLSADPVSGWKRRNRLQVEGRKRAGPLDTAISKEADTRVRKALEGSARGDLGRQPDAREADRLDPSRSLARSRRSGRTQRARGRSGRHRPTSRRRWADAIVTIDNRLAVMERGAELW